MGNEILISYIEKSYQHMGGTFSFRAYPGGNLGEEEITILFDQASSEIERIENLLTDFRSSPFQKINENAGLEPTKVDEEIFQLVKNAVQMSEITKGSFDISTASVGHLWRDYRKKNELPCPIEVEKRKQWINYKLIRLDPIKKTIFLPHKDMRITLGGIGKGYAVDKAFKFLKEKDLDNFYVNGSGDIRVSSKKSAPRPWKIGLRNPFAEDSSKAMGMVLLSNEAIASSGDYINTIEKDDEKFHHIISPKIGKSLNILKAVTVIAEETMEADVLATTLMTLSKQEATEYCMNKNLQAILVDTEGKVYISERLKKRQKQWKN
jgi:thiamine biosynthesis lipoprotein